LTPSRLLVAALASILAAAVVTAIYPHLVAHDASSTVLNATSALGASAAIAAPLLIIAAIVRRLAR
jgi:uncharacterized membrane protein